ncbi:hypothetical protein Pint_30049 [Pistacia integerrima]|uniref:Uncharacterized protein n=1 Tax=Pistacia integerrima TaxID=434235 RepID=A0ACC0X038_9ROSI|nr:hypothetical protein Pint_30049 [Pistacia integerrima]
MDLSETTAFWLHIIFRWLLFQALQIHLQVWKKSGRKAASVATLKSEGDFKDVAERVLKDSVNEKPIDPTIVGMQSIFDKVWRCLGEKQVGIIGLHGTGGVVASKDHQVEKIQEEIGEKIGLSSESWKKKSFLYKANDLFKILRKKKFVLLLDDIWERVDLKDMGIPHPDPNNGSKIVFSTRFVEVCGHMEAHKHFRVEFLGNEQAWELFRSKVGEDTLNNHPDILELARIVAKECGGLPLALITIGKAMAFKKTPGEWSYAIQMNMRELELEIKDTTLLVFLLNACLLEEVSGDDDSVKMHDVIRDMALWIASKVEKEKEKVFGPCRCETNKSTKG